MNSKVIRREKLTETTETTAIEITRDALLELLVGEYIADVRTTGAQTPKVDTAEIVFQPDGNVDGAEQHCHSCRCEDTPYRQGDAIRLILHRHVAERRPL